MAILSLLFAILVCVSPVMAPNGAEGTYKTYTQSPALKYYDGHEFTVIGRYHNEETWGRFPRRHEATLRDKVWALGQNSAGIGIRFRTDATTLVVRWTVLFDKHLAHMPDTGVKGVDLYVYDKGKWQYVRTGFPREKTNEAQLLIEGPGVEKEYLLNLPLYDGVESIEIGVNAEAQISKPRDPHMVHVKPVVYYGTSIAQGGCASRPGLAFTNILSRRLNRPFVNFGFSGNGTIETSVGEAMCEIDAALFVIDCNPNTKAELIHDRTVELVGMLKKKRPDVPVLLVEGFLYDTDHATLKSNQTVGEKNRELRRAYESLKDSGKSGLYYQRSNNFIGKDHEGTVDGVHPNDLGMMRIAQALMPSIKKLLQTKRDSLIFDR